MPRGPHIEALEGRGVQIPPPDSLGNHDSQRIHGAPGGIPDVLERPLYFSPKLTEAARIGLFEHVWLNYLREHVVGEEAISEVFSNASIKEAARKELFDKLLGEHIDRLNTPLREASLAPLFTETEYLMTTELKFPWFEKAKGVVKLANGVAMPLIDTFWGFKKDTNEPIIGQFGFLMLTQEEMQRNGAIQLVFTRGEVSLPEGEVKGQFRIASELLQTVNKGLTERGRANLPDTFGQIDNEGSPAVAGVDFHDENQRFFTIVTFHLGDGTSFPLLFNRLDEKGSHGEVSTIIFSDGTFGINWNAGRVLLQKIVPEIPRGFAKQGEDKWAHLWTETGLKPYEEMSGREIRFADFVEGSLLMQDPRTDFVFPTFNEVGFDASYKMGLPEEFRNATDRGFEPMVNGRMTPLQVVEAIKRGEFFDAHSISGLTLAMLRRGQLIVNPHYSESVNVVFEQKYLQTGEIGLVLPRGPIAKGEKIAELAPDTGKARIIYQTKTGPVSILEKGRKYVNLDISEAIGGMTRGTFNIVDSAALAQGLLQRGILVHKDTI